MSSLEFNLTKIVFSYLPTRRDDLIMVAYISRLVNTIVTKQKIHDEFYGDVEDSIDNEHIELRRYCKHVRDDIYRVLPKLTKALDEYLESLMGLRFPGEDDYFDFIYERRQKFLTFFRSNDWI